MDNFDFFHIDAEIYDGKVVGRAEGYLGDILQPLVQQFFYRLNALKVIAKVDGKNVYNLYNPPHPSPAGMRFLGRKVRMMFEKMAFPVTANLAITHKCQCQCIHCSADPFKDPTREELGVDEIKKVVDGAWKAGVAEVRDQTTHVLPFRGWIRKLTGAARHDRAVQAAIRSGGIRRGYLKGVGMRMNCAPPAAPSWFVPAPPPRPQAPESPWMKIITALENFLAWLRNLIG